MRIHDAFRSVIRHPLLGRCWVATPIRSRVLPAAASGVAVRSAHPRCVVTARPLCWQESPHDRPAGTRRPLAMILRSAAGPLEDRAAGSAGLVSALMLCVALHPRRCSASSARPGRDDDAALSAKHAVRRERRPARGATPDLPVERWGRSDHAEALAGGWATDHRVDRRIRGPRPRAAVRRRIARDVHTWMEVGPERFVFVSTRRVPWCTCSGVASCRIVAPARSRGRPTATAGSSAVVSSASETSSAPSRHPHASRRGVA